ncbi:MAG: hypothetical protein LBH19_01825 [Dysgonamonadaceae bacterium]|jgi:hypothetical protein|nr:hypothetical protein [Dysgonamonadaceae bacterium]
MKRQSIKIVALVLLLAGTAVACEEKETSDGYVKTGIVKYFPPPDNCNDYMIVVGDSIYKPDKLDEKYKVDNCEVQITYRMSGEKHNCGFGGDVPCINILKIEKL